MKSILSIATFALLTATSVFAASPEMTIGENYLLKVMDEKGVCGVNPTAVTMLGYSEKGDYIAVRPSNAKDGLFPVAIVAICEYQKALMTIDAPKK